MRVYGTMKNTNKVIKENSMGVTIDGIQLELKKNLGNEYCEGADIYLDFAEESYIDKGSLKTFRLINATIQVDGNEVCLDDNSHFVYELIRNSVAKEFIISGIVLEDMKEITLLGSLKFDIGERTVHLKTNKVRFC